MEECFLPTLQWQTPKKYRDNVIVEYPNNIGFLSTMKSSAAYLRFLNLTKSIEALPAAPGLDLIEREVLSALALRWNKNQPILIADAISLKEIASQATLHGRLKQLKKKGLVKIIPDSSDGRRKYIEPTQKSRNYFDQMAKCVVRAAKA